MDHSQAYCKVCQSICYFFSPNNVSSAVLLAFMLLAFSFLCINLVQTQMRGEILPLFAQSDHIAITLDSMLTIERRKRKSNFFINFTRAQSCLLE